MEQGRLDDVKHRSAYEIAWNIISGNTLMLSWKQGEICLLKFSDSLKNTTRLMPSPSESQLNIETG
jgi:hypothetical protein